MKKDAKATAAIREWDEKVKQNEQQLEDIDVDAAKYGYQDIKLEDYDRSALEELIRWRLWNRTGGGLMAELGSHQLDAASIFISADHVTDRKAQPQGQAAVRHRRRRRHIFPATATATTTCIACSSSPAAATTRTPTGHEVADPNKKIVVTYSSINGNGYGGYGEIVFGTKGTLILEQEQDAMLFKGSDTTTRIEVKQTGRQGRRWTPTKRAAARPSRKPATGGNTSRGYREEIEHWAWCIRNPDSGPQAALHAGSGDGRRHHRAHQQPGDRRRQADRVRPGLVRRRPLGNARRHRPAAGVASGVIKHRLLRRLQFEADRHRISTKGVASRQSQRLTRARSQ